MATNQHDDLVSQIEADEARRAATQPRPRRPSVLGHPWVAGISLAVCAVSGLWSHARMQEPFPPPPLSREDRVAGARYLLVNARAAVEEYYQRSGSYPEDLGPALGEGRRAFIGYLRADDGVGYSLAISVDDELIRLDSGDDPSRFLQDGSHVPMTPPTPAPEAATAPTP